MAFNFPGDGHLGRVLVCGGAFQAPEVRTALKQLGYEAVGEAADTEGAVRAARALRPDIILIEGDFPPHGGIGTTRRIARECPTVIIIARGSGDRQWVQRAMEAGASGYLTLPLRPDDLGPALLLASSHFNQLRLYERLATEMREANERLLISGLREQQYALQLRKLADVTAEIHASTSLQSVIQIVVDRGRELLEGEIGGILIEAETGTARAFSVSGADSSGMAAEVGPRITALCSTTGERDAVRLPGAEAIRFLYSMNALLPDGYQPGGILAVCLYDMDREAVGVLWLVKRSGEDFTEEDEAVLRQIAQITSLALSSARFQCKRAY